ncbi:MAG: hypothetical protein PHX43_09075 [Alphaproteobacteria bacterium]|nr:hypothetical protein [Alphaproteobacteria bacterium]
MDNGKVLIQEAIEELLGEGGGSLLPDQKYKDAYRSFYEGIHGNSSKALGGQCGHVAALLRDYFRQHFHRNGVDGDCLRVSSADCDHSFHCYNLVRINQDMFLVDATAAQFMKSPKDAFPETGFFVGTRDDLKAMLDQLNDRMPIRENLWEDAWGSASVPVGEQDIPADPFLWGRELKNIEPARCLSPPVKHKPKTLGL